MVAAGDLSHGELRSSKQEMASNTTNEARSTRHIIIPVVITSFLARSKFLENHEVHTSSITYVR